MEDDNGNNDPHAHLPSNLRGVVKHVGFAPFEGTDEETEIFDLVRQGHCMTCRTTLGDTTILLVTRNGIVAGFCSGQCETDMAVLGFIQETHDNLITAIDFRGSRYGDAA